MIQANRPGRALRRLWRRFMVLSKQMDGLPLDELPLEDVAPWFSAFDDLLAAGVRFDESFIQHIRAIKETVTFSEEVSERENENDLQLATADCWEA